MPARSVLITGCSSGIGLATARLLKARGWQVVASARKPGDVARLKAEGFDAVHLDVSDTGRLARVLEEVYALTDGRLEALVNNAGIAMPGAVEDLSPGTLREQFDTN